MKIGILGFQGAVIEHQRHIEQLGQEAVSDLNYDIIKVKK